MLRKYRYFAIGLFITAIIVLLCLFVPGALLQIGSVQEIGRAQQADQLYYADNVYASDAVNFDLGIRLLMKSGQWKSDQTMIAETEVAEDDHILSKEQMRAYCAVIFNYLTQELWTDENYAMDMVENYNYSATAREYIARLNGTATESVEIYAPETTAQEAAALAPEETKAVEAALSFRDQLALAPYEYSSLQLCRYEDRVLNSYYFYVWEYTIQDEALGIDASFEVDAVTLEIYSMSIHGSLFDELPWAEVWQLMWIYHEAEFADWANVYLGQFQGSSIPVSPTSAFWVLINAYWMDMQNELAAHYDEITLAEGEPLQTQESGYSYWEGNFMMQSPVTIIQEDASDWMRLENSMGDAVYANSRFINGGFEWYMAAERS